MRPATPVKNGTKKLMEFSRLKLKWRCSQKDDARPTLRYGRHGCASFPVVSLVDYEDVPRLRP